MLLPDVNILIYAFRADVPEHLPSRRWLTALVEDNKPFAMSRLALSAVVRITTTVGIYRQPSSLDEVFSFCGVLAEQPNCRFVEPGEKHWAIFEDICRSTETRGKRVTDAWFAALAIEHGCEWVTLDRDYARFPGLRWRTPEQALTG
ncbi:MAG: type II toxin-antitoxin system VapC family toxin [Parvularculaceae bacterium]